MSVSSFDSCWTWSQFVFSIDCSQIELSLSCRVCCSFRSKHCCLCSCSCVVSICCCLIWSVSWYCSSARTYFCCFSSCMCRSSSCQVWSIRCRICSSCICCNQYYIFCSCCQVRMYWILCCACSTITERPCSTCRNISWCIFEHNNQWSCSTEWFPNKTCLRRCCWRSNISGLCFCVCSWCISSNQCYCVCTCCWIFMYRTLHNRSWIHWQSNLRHCSICSQSCCCQQSSFNILCCS